MITLENLAALVREMRLKQKAFYKAKTTVALLAAKKLEDAVDRALVELEQQALWHKGEVDEP